LAKHYWWAYLSPWGLRIFDHPFMVNRILWGQYHKIAQATVKVLKNEPAGQLAQISCAYGEIIPLVASQANASAITLLDVTSIQLASARKKLALLSHCPVQLIKANADELPMADNSYNNSLLFFLLHELPLNVRSKVLKEALRITQPSGRLVIAEYGPLREKHLFHKNKFFRSIFEKLEPFLGNFWRCDLETDIVQAAEILNKNIEVISKQYFWNGFYRLWEIRVN